MVGGSSVSTRSDEVTLGFGAVLFGIGWGLVGICPGPALAGTAAWQRGDPMEMGRMCVSDEYGIFKSLY